MIDVQAMAERRATKGKLRGKLRTWLDVRQWAYAIPGSRDYRLDLLRGFFVFAMVVDHFGGDSLLTAISGNNQFLVSAAEGFVFVSGLLMGIVYGGRARRLGLAAGVKAVLHRAAVLYITVVSLTLAFVGLYLFTDLPLWMDRSGGLGVEKPLHAVVGTLTLHYSYHATDILLIYVLLVGAAPLALYLLTTGRTAHLMAGSWLLWALYQVAPEQAAVPWTVANSVSFPFAAWQALFYTGLVLGYHRARLAPLTRALRRWPAVALLAAAAAGMVALSRAHHAGQLASLGLSDESFQFLFDKASLGPGRVAAFFLLAALALQVTTLAWTPLQRALGWLLIPLGQKSLLSYGAHLFVLGPSYVAYGLAASYLPEGPTLNLLLQAAVLLSVWAFVKSQARLAALASQARLAAQHLATATASPALAWARASVPRRTR